MRFGKLAAGLPAALLVGVVVHIAAAGFDHAPGGRNAIPLAVGLAVALLLSFAIAFARGAFATVQHSIPTRAEIAYAIVALALGGTAAYCSIELLEGHFEVDEALRAVATSLPVAALVRTLFRHAGSAAVAAGTGLGSFLRERRGSRNPSSRFVSHAHTRRFARRKLEGRPHAGRAPPLLRLVRPSARRSAPCLLATF